MLILHTCSKQGRKSQRKVLAFTVTLLNLLLAQASPVNGHTNRASSIIKHRTFHAAMYHPRAGVGLCKCVGQHSHVHQKPGLARQPRPTPILTTVGVTQDKTLREHGTRPPNPNAGNLNGHAHGFGPFVAEDLTPSIVETMPIAPQISHALWVYPKVHSLVA